MAGLPPLVVPAVDSVIMAIDGFGKSVMGLNAL